MSIRRFTSFAPAIVISVGASMFLLGLLDGAGFFEQAPGFDPPHDSMVGDGYIAPD